MLASPLSLVRSTLNDRGRRTERIANLALSLLSTSQLARPPRIGLLDLDIFGPSVPKLMGLENAGDPELSKEGKLVPLSNHGVKTMSIGYLLRVSATGGSYCELTPLAPNPANDSPVVWRGMMVMKAVQQVCQTADHDKGI